MRRLVALFLLSFCLALPATAPRAQESDVAPGFQTPGVLIDYHEEMRRFIQSISSYARAFIPNFLIIPHDGLELLVKVDVIDQTKVSPARTFMRSIDGILATAPHYGLARHGIPTPPDHQTRIHGLLDTAKQNRLLVFSLDLAHEQAMVDDAVSKARAKGWVPFVAHMPPALMNEIPSHHKRPVDEHPRSVMSAKSVQNFLYLRESGGYGTESEFTMAMRDTNFDVLVLDVFHGRRALSKRAVADLKFKKVGGRRLVLAYINIGQALSHAYYWQDWWGEGVPPFISAPYPNEPDRYFVEFWDPQWQAIITGSPTSFIWGLMDLGFDGVVLDGLDSVKYFEGGVEALKVEE